MQNIHSGWFEGFAIESKLEIKAESPFSASNLTLGKVGATLGCNVHVTHRVRLIRYDLMERLEQCEKVKAFL